MAKTEKREFMTDKELIRLLRVALSIAAIEAHKNIPAYIPDNLSAEEFTQLYIDTSDDAFGERFITHWIDAAKKELGW